MDSLELVKKHLSPYLSILHKSIIMAWEEYHKDFSKIIHKTSALAPSVIMNGLVVNFAKKYFDGYNNVEIKKNSHSAIFIIRSSTDNFRIDLRFKKLDKYYRTHNARSARNTNFVNQVHEPYLGEVFQPIPQTKININAGFQIGETWDKIEIYITCPNGARSIAWKFGINDNDSLPVENVSRENVSVEPRTDKKRIEPIMTPEKQKNIGN